VPTAAVNPSRHVSRRTVPLTQGNGGALRRQPGKSPAHAERPATKPMMSASPPIGTVWEAWPPAVGCAQIRLFCLAGPVRAGRPWLATLSCRSQPAGDLGQAPQPRPGQVAESSHGYRQHGSGRPQG